MPAAAVLAKVAIPLGIGLVLLASRRGSSKEREDRDKAISLTRRAVRAMQGNTGGDLEAVIQDFDSEDDPTTAGALRFQLARMISRGGPGFTQVPTDDRDSVLKINNKEFAPRLIQLEGRVKALDAWAEAYESIGAKKLAKDLRDKAAAFRKLTDPKANDESDSGESDSDDDRKPSDNGKPSNADKLADVVKRVTAALATLDPEKMRAEADKLERDGFKEQADSLRKAADELEAERKAKEKPAEPAKPAEPLSVRTYTVQRNDSEALIARRFTGTDSRLSELVAANVPKDADGRKRTKITASNRQALGEPQVRVGGLHPGLVPGQRLILPSNWPASPGASPSSPAKPKQLPPASNLPESTRALIAHVVGKNPGKEDQFLVKRFQGDNKRTTDGKYGMNDALFIANTFREVPPTPLYWPKKDTAKALKTWQSEMARLALEIPDKAEGFRFAAAAGKQPGFNAPLSSKVVSRLLGDGLGAV